MRHRLFLLVVIVALLALAAQCQPVTTPQTVVETVVVTVEVPAEAAEAMEAETTLRILSLPWPQTPVEQELANELFTPEAGVKVEITGPPYQFVESKIRELCASQSAEFDIFEIDSQWYGGAILGDCIQPLDEFLAEAGIDYDETFVQPYATYNGRWPIPNEVLRDPELWQEYTDQPVYFLPWTIGTMILGYRTDLFEEAGIVDENGQAKAPQTWDEFLEAAHLLTVDAGDNNITEAGFDPDNVVRYGIGWYAGRISDGITQQWLPFHASFGADFWDSETWQAQGIINAPEAIQACEVFTSFNLEEGVVDPGTANWFVDELLNGAFTDKYAMNFTWVSFAGAMDNPDISETAGKWGYAPFPCHEDPETGERTCAATYGSQGIGINKFSANKEAAWQYLNWLISKDIQQQLIDDPRAGFASARVDLQDVQTQEEGTARWASLTSINNFYGFDVWTYPEYAQLLDIQQNYINLAYIGQTECQSALDQIAVLQQRILDTSPNNPQNQ